MIAVGKVHDEEMGLAPNAGDDDHGFAKVRLRMTRRMGQRHEHLAETAPPLAHVIFDDGLTTLKAMLIAKALEDPLRRVPLLAMG